MPLNFETQVLPVLRKRWLANFPGAAALDADALDRFLMALVLYGTSISLPSAQQARHKLSAEAARVAFEEYAQVVKPECLPNDVRMQTANLMIIAMALDEAVGGIMF